MERKNSRQTKIQKTKGKKKKKSTGCGCVGQLAQPRPAHPPLIEEPHQYSVALPKGRWSQN